MKIPVELTTATPTIRRRIRALLYAAPETVVNETQPVLPSGHPPTLWAKPTGELYVIHSDGQLIEVDTAVPLAEEPLTLSASRALTSADYGKRLMLSGYVLGPPTGAHIRAGAFITASGPGVITLAGGSVSLLAGETALVQCQSDGELELLSNYIRGNRTTTSATPPAGALDGDEWIDSESMRVFVMYHRPPRSPMWVEQGVSSALYPHVTEHSPVSGATIQSLPVVDETLYVTPLAPISQLNWVLPSAANSRPGQVKMLYTTQTITNLSVSVSGGVTLPGATSLPANYPRSYQCVKVLGDVATWIKFG